MSRPSNESLTFQPTEEIELRHQVLDIPTGRPLMTLQESRQQQHINAAVLVEFTLPTFNSTGEPKKIQLLDFGEDTTEHGKALFYMPEMGDMRHVATSRSRFALMGANYTPNTHMFGFCELPVGKTTIGREATSRTSYLLGLSDDPRPGSIDKANRMLSRQQLTIQVTEQGDITAEDHSTNGTLVKLALRDLS